MFGTLQNRPQKADTRQFFFETKEKENPTSNMVASQLSTVLVLLQLSFIAAQSDQGNAICGASKTCSTCTPVDGCGWCSDELTSGDGSTKEMINTCVAINSTHSGSPPEGRRCNAGYHTAVCPCPNQCSSHGVCEPEGTCQCFRAYTGEDCSTAKETVINPGVVIPLTIVAIGALGASLVWLHLHQSGEARDGKTRSAKKRGRRGEPIDGIVMKSSYPRYTDAIN